MSAREEEPALHFIAVTPGDENRRQYELKIAAAKSHAARVSYHRKSPRKPVRKRRHVEQKDQKIRGLVKSPSNNNSSLDPFVRLSVDLDLKERYLVHEYLTEVPQALYGTALHAAFCPVRALTFEAIAENEIWLGWILFLARYRKLVLSGRTPARDRELLHYRSSTYRLIGRQVAALQPNTSSDDVFHGLLAAAIAEHRTGDTENAQLHLEAGLNIICMKRELGIKLPSLSGTGLIMAGSYIPIGVLNYFKTSRQLLAAGRLLLQRLRRMAVRNPAPEGKCSNSPARADSCPTQGAYLNLRTTMCRADSVLRRNIRDLSSRTNIADVRIRLASLFALNSILEVTRGNEAVAIEFLEELTHYLSNSAARTSTDQPMQLSPTVVMYIISFCGANLAKRYGSHYFDIWDVVDALEFIMLAEPETRGKLGKVMESWLFAETPDATFDEKDEWAMIKEVNAMWLVRHAQLTVTLTG